MNDHTPLTLQTTSVQQTMAIGRAVGSCCQAGDIVALDGELGAGKTQFVRGLAEGMGLNPRQVSSPTFVMVQEYEPEDAESAAPVLVHIDAYRLKSAEDLASIGWHDDGAELREGAAVAIEWASMIEPMLGPDMLKVQIEHEADGRRISLSAQGAWRARMKMMRERLSGLD